jgi:ethanolamine utilization protein EutA
MGLSEGSGAIVVNVDIGGGTTKVSVIDDGIVTHLEAFSVGARLLAFDSAGEVVRREEPAGILLDELGRPAELGDILGPDERAQVADLMARVIVDLLTGSDATRSLMGRLQVATDGRPVPGPDQIKHIVFSGGVSEFLSDSPPEGFGDMGADLGRSLRSRLAAAGLSDKIVPAVQGIRATVLGASQFTVQASGQTCFVSDHDILPAVGLRAVKVDFRPEPSAAAVRAALSHHDLSEWDGSLAAVISLGTVVDYRTIRAAADALTTVASEADPALSLFVVMREDLAHSLGGILKEELHWAGAVTVVDGITVDDLDHLDIGTPLGVSGSLPVTVTSLEFPQVELADQAVPLSS